MTRRDMMTAMACSIVAACGASRAILAQGASATQTAEAERWAKEMAAFAADDEARPFAAGGLVFVGSSSIRLWDLAAAFPGRPALNRGFGGSQIPDSVRHVERLVLRHTPRTVIFYAGDNDLAAGRTPAQVLADFQAFVAAIHGPLPATRIAFVAIKPSLARWAIVDKVRDTNARIREACDADDRLGFVDVDGPMIGWNGKPRADLFVADGLHLSAKGYALWNVLVTPFLD